jgi:hypothetical protein
MRDTKIAYLETRLEETKEGKKAVKELFVFDNPTVFDFIRVIRSCIDTRVDTSSKASFRRLKDKVIGEQINRELYIQRVTEKELHVSNPFDWLVRGEDNNSWRHPEGNIVNVDDLKEYTQKLYKEGDIPERWKKLRKLLCNVGWSIAMRLLQGES